MRALVVKVVITAVLAILGLDKAFVLKLFI